jgi:fatty acid desaturase
LPLDESTESSSVENENQTNLFHVLAIESVKYMIRVVLFFVMPSGNDHFRVLNMDLYHWDRGDFTSKPLTLLKTAFREIHFTQWLVISLSFVWTMFLNTAMVMGIYSSIKRKELRIVTVFLVVIVYFAIATGAAFGARFRVPILPYLILLSSYGLVHRFRLLKNRAGNNKE